MNQFFSLDSSSEIINYWLYSIILFADDPKCALIYVHFVEINVKRCLHPIIKKIIILVMWVLPKCVDYLWFCDYTKWAVALTWSISSCIAASGFKLDSVTIPSFDARLRFSQLSQAFHHRLSGLSKWMNSEDFGRQKPNTHTKHTTHEYWKVSLTPLRFFPQILIGASCTGAFIN